MNSQFEKKNEKKATRADNNSEGPPYNAERYAEIDAVLTNKRTRNMVKDVEADTGHFSRQIISR